MRAPTSFKSRLKSGDSRTILPAAARSRSTASGGNEKDVGRLFRYAPSSLSLSLGNDTSITYIRVLGDRVSLSSVGALRGTNDGESRIWGIVIHATTMT